MAEIVSRLVIGVIAIFTNNLVLKLWKIDRHLANMISRTKLTNEKSLMKSLKDSFIEVSALQWRFVKEDREKL